MYRGDEAEDFEPVRPQMMDDMDLEDSQSYGHGQMKTQGSYSKIGYD